MAETKETGQRPSDKSSAGENVSRYRLVDYCDVWGNPEDGWDVNNIQVLFDDLNITGDATETAILEYLHGVGYLRSKNPEDYEVDWTDPCFCEIFQAKDGMPLCRLEAIA